MSKRGFSEQYERRLKLLSSIQLILTLMIWIIVGILFQSAILGFFIALMAYVILILIVRSIIFKTASEEDKRYADECRENNNQKIQKINNNPSIKGVKYISGVKNCINEKNGILTIEKENLGFYENLGIEELFTIKLSSIKNIVHDSSERITLSRALVFGLGAFIFKKKTYYLVVEYIAKNGVQNQLIIDTGVNIYSQFFNQLNTARNEYAINETNPNDIIRQIERLSELKEKNIISSEEFELKKSVLLEKIN